MARPPGRTWNGIEGRMEQRTLLVGLAHPDDEVGAAGTILAQKARGDRVVVVWLTRGEMTEAFGAIPTRGSGGAARGARPPRGRDPGRGDAFPGHAGLRARRRPRVRQARGAPAGGDQAGRAAHLGRLVGARHAPPGPPGVGQDLSRRRHAGAHRQGGGAGHAAPGVRARLHLSRRALHPAGRGGGRGAVRGHHPRAGALLPRAHRVRRPGVAGAAAANGGRRSTAFATPRCTTRGRRTPAWCRTCSPRRPRRATTRTRTGGCPPPASRRLVHPLPQTAREGGCTSTSHGARSNPRMGTKFSPSPAQLRERGPGGEGARGAAAVEAREGRESAPVHSGRRRTGQSAQADFAPFQRRGEFIRSGRGPAFSDTSRRVRKQSHPKAVPSTPNAKRRPARAASSSSQRPRCGRSRLRKRGCRPACRSAGWAGAGW